TAAELRAEIERVLTRRPVEARVPTRAYVAWTFVARHRVSVTAAVAAAAVLFAGSGAILWQSRRAGQERVRADRERQGAELARRDSEQVSRFLLGLFEAHDPANARGRELSARALIGRGVQQAEALAAQPLLQARLFDT